jgi:hypothetical protein
MKVYAKCIDCQEDAAKRCIEGALALPDGQDLNAT